MENNKKRKNAFLSFKIGKETFAVSVKKALEVLEKQNITTVPNVPEYIEGVINFRGNIIPVVDTRLKFNLSKRNEGAKYVVIVFDLIIEEKKMLIGAIADSVEDVIALDETNIMPVPEMGFKYNSDYILGMLKNERSFTMILDIDKVFASEDVSLYNKEHLEEAIESKSVKTKKTKASKG